MVFYILIFFNIVHRVTEFIANKYLHRSYFRIGFSNENLNLDVNTYQHIMNPPNVYRADPFLVEKSGNYYIFFEEYSFLDAKGSIAAIEISNRKEVKELGKILEDDYHMSFPFVFEDNDEFYMVLETKSIGKIMLYRNQIWPDKWELVKVLLDNIKAVDPLVFKHEGLWWIICTIDSAGTGLEQSELHVFYSEDLLHGEWLAHPSNPVLIDSYYGRNAGFFEKDSKLFRCSQSYKNFRYGFQLNFHEILKLTPEVYQEELTKIPSIENCHTYSTTKSFTVIDYKS